jgi:shikimate dehydrogenase
VTGRDASKAAALSAEFGVSSADAKDLPGMRADVWVNATPLGSADDDPLPFPVSVLGPEIGIVDFVYRREGETTLVRTARARGASIADGLELLARQAVGQAVLFGVADATLEEIDAILRGGSVEQAAARTGT